jgi:hypothetical protein
VDLFHGLAITISNSGQIFPTHQLLAKVQNAQTLGRISVGKWIALHGNTHSLVSCDVIREGGC